MSGKEGDGENKIDTLLKYLHPKLPHPHPKPNKTKPHSNTDFKYVFFPIRL